MPQEPLVIAVSSGRTLAAFRGQDGSLAWRHTLAHQSAAQVFPGTSLAWSGQYVVMEAADGYLMALHPADGTVVWESDFFYRRQQGQPELRGGQRVLAADPLVIARNALGEIAAFDSADGRRRWTSLWKGELVALGDGRGYILTRRGSQYAPSQRAVLRVLSAQTGRQLWTAGKAFPWGLHDSNIGMARERDGVAYLWGNQLHALDARTGKNCWRQHVPAQRRRPMFGVGEVCIYLIERQAGGPSTVFAYRRDTGEPAWRVTSDNYEVFNWLHVMGDMVVVARSVASGMQVEAWDSLQGTVRWIWPSDPSLVQADYSWRLVGANGILYVPIPRKSGEGIAAVRASDGQQLWRIALPIEFGDLLAIPAF